MSGVLFFLTIFVQYVCGWSTLRNGIAYLPLGNSTATSYTAGFADSGGRGPVVAAIMRSWKPGSAWGSLQHLPAFPVGDVDELEP